MATVNDVRLQEALCDRFMMIQEASGLSKSAFGRRLGLKPSQVTNIATYRNPPSHEVILAAMKEFGITADWFYSGVLAGLRDEGMADRLRELARTPR